jgi:uncharacterized protein
MSVIEFDAEKDMANLAKHGISLDRAKDIKVLAIVEDDRFDYGETRYRAFGLIDDQAHCLVFAERNDVLRAISLRRAHAKEMSRHVKTQTTKND